MARSQGDPVGNCRPVDQFENERRRAAVLFEPIDRGNVRMVQGGERPGFPLESGDTLRISDEHRRKNLDGDVSSEFRVARPIHFAHAAGSESGDDLVRTEACTGGEDQTVAVDYTGGRYGSGLLLAPHYE